MKTSSFLAVLIVFVLGFSVISATAQSEETTGSRKVITRVSPNYPTIARNMNLTGSVRLEAVVASNGTVKSIQVRGGNPVLVQAAESAVQAWKWEKSDRETVESVEFRFNP